MRRKSRFEPKIPPLFDLKKGDKVECRTKRDEKDIVVHGVIDSITPKECVIYFPMDGTRITLTELSDVRVHGKMVYFC